MAAGHPRAKPRLEARPPRLHRRQGDAAGPPGPRRRHRLDAAGRHVRCAGPHRQRRRRSPLHRVLRRGRCLVSARSRSTLPGGVTATVSGQTIEVKGPKGTRAFTATDDVTLAVEDGARHGDAARHLKRARQQWGMSRTQVANLVTGVTTGFKKEMDITGVGYRAAVQGKILKLSLGYSHDVDFEMPAGVTVTTPKPTEIVVEGIDQQVVGQVAAEHPRMAQARALQGQGHQVQGRVHLPQGRQEEVRSAHHGEQQARAVPEAPPARPEQAAEDGRRPSAPQRPPVQEEHLGPADRRRPGPDPGRRLDARDGRWA